MWAGACVQAELLLRGVPSRSGTTAGAWFARRALARRLGGTCRRPQPRSHAGRWIRFLFCPFGGREGPYVTSPHSSSRSDAISRISHGAIMGAGFWNSQVNRVFRIRGGAVNSRTYREPNHGHFVSWHTGFAGFASLDLSRLSADRCHHTGSGVDAVSWITVETPATTLVSR
jgi:hypothetical protein